MKFRCTIEYTTYFSWLVRVKHWVVNSKTLLLVDLNDVSLVEVVLNGLSVASFQFRSFFRVGLQGISVTLRLKSSCSGDYSRHHPTTNRPDIGIRHDIIKVSCKSFDAGLARVYLFHCSERLHFLPTPKLIGQLGVTLTVRDSFEASRDEWRSRMQRSTKYPTQR